MLIKNILILGANVTTGQYLVTKLYLLWVDYRKSTKNFRNRYNLRKKFDTKC
jgi:hypothetical protein